MLEYLQVLCYMFTYVYSAFAFNRLHIMYDSFDYQEQCGIM